MVDRTRTSGIFNAANWGATIIGAGGIGAMTAIVLAKMGLSELIICDDDEVSQENVATQMYGPSDVGRKKVFDLEEWLAMYVDDVTVSPYLERVNQDTDWFTIASPIIVSAVDSIASRQKIWETIKDEPWMWYIDARMAAEELLIYTVDHKDRTWYNDQIYIFREEDIPELPCTSKATFFCGAVAGGFLGSTVRQIITGERPPKILSLDIHHGTLLKV